MDRHQKGINGELIAERFLKNNGYHIVAHNYRCRFGEIDLIAENDEFLIFIEVKYRRSDTMGLPEESVTIQKQRKICQCALFYLADHPLKKRSVRFDVISILGDKITHFKHAFEFHQ